MTYYREVNTLTGRTSVITRSNVRHIQVNNNNVVVPELDTPSGETDADDETMIQDGNRTEKI